MSLTGVRDDGLPDATWGGLEFMKVQTRTERHSKHKTYHRILLHFLRLAKREGVSKSRGTFASFAFRRPPDMDGEAVTHCLECLVTGVLLSARYLLHYK